MTALTVEGELRTDGSIVYINGMDLGSIIAHALPGPDDLKYPGCKDYRGEWVISITQTTGRAA